MGSSCSTCYYHTVKSSTTMNSIAVNNAIKKLHELKINLLAIDFDQTFIDIHTGGRWPGSVDELVPHVRPEFQQLVTALFEQNQKQQQQHQSDNVTQEEQHSFCVAIVTFSSQPQLIRNVLEQCIGVNYTNQIPIRGGDRSWTYSGNGSHEGKQAHIASAVEELQTNDTNIVITKATTLLIDDDMKNIRCALRDGTRAIWFNPSKPYLLLQDIAKLV